jgi:hypothetical protein
MESPSQSKLSAHFHLMELFYTHSNSAMKAEHLEAPIVTQN